ncbi:MAG: DNA polymerase III subunit chi [Pseudomonadota bacterium]
MQVSFYHLEKQDVSAALPRLLEKVIAAGHKVAVFLRGEEQLETLDAALWTYDANSFLPHGRSGGKHSDLQPIYLTTGQDVPNQADILVALDAQLPEDLTAFSRCLYMFDSRQDGATEQARRDWSALKDQGHDVTYWQQSAQGRWEKKA